MTRVIKSNDEFNKVINSNLVSVVDLYATWCGPCRMLAPIIDKVSEESNGRYTVIKVDVDEFEEIAIKYGVNTIPTLLYIKNGELLEKSVGLRSEETILSTIEKYI